jgi:hypothetical protein
LGKLGTAQAVASFTHSNCSTVFPIAGCADNFTTGEDLDLHESFFFGLYTQSFPVQVVTLEPTYWTFEALQGHPEGAGRTITFSFVGNASGDVDLNIYTSTNGSALTQWPILRNLDFFIAHQTWDGLANNIEAQY